MLVLISNYLHYFTLVKVRTALINTRALLRIYLAILTSKLVPVAISFYCSEAMKTQTMLPSKP